MWRGVLLAAAGHLILVAALETQVYEYYKPSFFYTTMAIQMENYNFCNICKHRYTVVMSTYIKPIYF
jgi:hypothetical protein